MTTSTTGQKRFADAFEAHAEQWRQGAGAWLYPEREAALAKFNEVGFPTRRDEEWKYSNVSKLLTLEADSAAPSATATTSSGEGVPGLAGPSLVFVNGSFSADLSSQEGLPTGVHVGSLERALENEPDLLRKHLNQWQPTTEHAFGHLNTALFRDGAFVHVPAGVKLEAPVQLIFVSEPGGSEMSHIRNVFVVEDGAEACVVESHRSHSPDAQFFTNVVTEAVCGESGRLAHIKLQEEADSAYHVSSLRAHQAKGSRFENHFVSLGGFLVRNEIEARIEGEHAECILNGVFVTDQERQVDNNTLIHHSVPNCESHEVYKGVLGDRAQGVFKGKIFVHEDAQKTDAKQSSSNLLLSADAQANSQPNLEIYADDVRCTHGATIGQLDAEALFYLRARGIPKKSAQRILTQAFVQDVVGQIPDPIVREYVEQRSSERLDRILGA